MGKVQQKPEEEEKLKNASRSSSLRSSCKKSRHHHVSLYNTRSKRTKFDELPIELLVEIFSYLSHADLFLNIRPVCPIFFYVSGTQSLWRKIRAGPEISTGLLERWLELSPQLRVLELNSRLDAAAILKKVVKHNKNLEEIRVQNCWGSKRQINLPSDALCNLLLRCPYLHTISLTGSRFISCKFFKLMALCEHLHNKKKKLDEHRRANTVSFSGCASLKQLRVFLNTRKITKSSRLSYLSVESQTNLMPEFSNTQEIIAETEEDIERILQSIQSLR